MIITLSILLQITITFAGITYLIAVHYYRDFWELDAVDDSFSETIIECNKVHFAWYCIPEIKITDNGS